MAEHLADLRSAVTGRLHSPGVTGPSQCDRVLAVLEDGRPHTIEEIHAIAGTMRLNSRVAELRTRGHHITCARRGDTYAYQLIRTLAEPEPPSPQVSAPRTAHPARTEAEIVALLAREGFIAFTDTQLDGIGEYEQPTLFEDRV